MHTQGAAGGGGTKGFQPHPAPALCNARQSSPRRGAVPALRIKRDRNGTLCRRSLELGGGTNDAFVKCVAFRLRVSAPCGSTNPNM
jgi:hypothetical protein